jgi:hypothetical protein
MRIQTERDFAVQQEVEMLEQATVRAAHREMQDFWAREQNRSQPEAASTRQQRED